MCAPTDGLILLLKIAQASNLSFPTQCCFDVYLQVLPAVTYPVAELAVPHSCQRVDVWLKQCRSAC